MRKNKMQYKCVPAPKKLNIGHDGSHDDALSSFADIINSEINDGWKFHSMEQVSVTRQPPKAGCLGGLLILIGLKKAQLATTTSFNMLIFSNAYAKDVLEKDEETAQAELRKEIEQIAANGEIISNFDKKIELTKSKAADDEPNDAASLDSQILSKAKQSNEQEGIEKEKHSNQKKLIFGIVGGFAILVIVVSFFLVNFSQKKETARTGGVISQTASNIKSVYKEALVSIEGGNFNMGSYDGGDDTKPVHMVTLKSFSIGKYPVTQKEYEEVMGYNPSKFMGQNRPVDYVSWYDAIEYCNKLSEKEGLTPAYTIDKSRQDYNNTNNDDNMKWIVIWNRSANGYRLPTEAEWEYAAKGGKGSPGNFKYSGSNNINEVAWHKHNSGGTSHDVGTKKPNNLGLYDMSGNVDEW